MEVRVSPSTDGHRTPDPMGTPRRDVRSMCLLSTRPSRARCSPRGRCRTREVPSPAARERHTHVPAPGQHHQTHPPPGSPRDRRGPTQDGTTKCDGARFARNWRGQKERQNAPPCGLDDSAPHSERPMRSFNPLRTVSETELGNRARAARGCFSTPSQPTSSPLRAGRLLYSFE